MNPFIKLSVLFCFFILYFNFLFMLPGHGEEALETEKDFSRYGRVNYVLKTRLELLNEVNFYFFIFLI